MRLIINLKKTECVALSKRDNGSWERRIDDDEIKQSEKVIFSVSADD